jgi:hypothetical protein
MRSKKGVGMKKAYSVSAFLFVMVFSQVSFAGDSKETSGQLESLAQRFSENDKNLGEIAGNMFDLGKALGDIYLAVLFDKIEKAELITHFSGRLVSFYADTKDAAKKSHGADTISTLEKSGKRMQGTLKEVLATQKFVPYPPVVELVDKAKAAMELSIQLIDEAVGVLKAQAD